MDIFLKTVEEPTQYQSPKSIEQFQENTIWIGNESDSRYPPVSNGLGSIYEYKTNLGFYYIFMGKYSFDINAQYEYKYKTIVFDDYELSQEPLNDENIQNLIDTYFQDSDITFERVYLE